MFSAEVKVEDRLAPVDAGGVVLFYSYDKKLNQLDKRTMALTRIYDFGQDDPSGGQFYLKDRQLFYSTGNFELFAFNLDTRKNKRIRPVRYRTNGVMHFNNEYFFID